MKFFYITIFSTVFAVAGLCNGAASTAITLDQLNKAIPARASDGSCASVSTPSECAPNSRAVVAINAAIAKYGVTKRGEIVALVSLMATESADWQYNINHYPGVPGQGTRAMLMYNFVQQYAQSLYPSQVTQALAGGSSTAAMNNVRALVLNDNDSFGSAFWYLTTQAASYHNNATRLRSGNASDFKNYVVNGVRASWSSDRQATWKAVNAALLI
ncbi:hypothetical protein GGI04_000656 [Coemansia thaxteri]|uniref:Uncharacterized protein n=1 Tax=Coemansia thaxteri TaxID=2663907 RepID=A0A9W8EJ75_9FUNG|nr:hypothetical protein H4R26_002766 [Coemansia thaxteri]KAJ2009183.1 hypothetical protein GGI04_000656 [Coemansia thaxteri]KAJ2459503.1 hypothetical protein GGI02_005872 [Coemansia sp. RSA 2322]KAJ2484623.1 hypothetical protein EV174_002288 [Coemansia sp. RSA 2320]